MPERTPIRHGEVLLLPVERVPGGVAQSVTECIVGHSESGHHHVLEAGAVFTRLVAANGDLYVDLDAPTPLRHRKSQDQHRELTVPRGAWRVLTKTEFDVRAMPLAPPDPPVRPERRPPTEAELVWERRWTRLVRD